MPSIRKTLFKLSASTRLRNRDVARQVKQHLSPGDSVIDAGCGEFGLAPFLAPTPVVGVDIVGAKGDDPNFRFVEGSIIELPFESQQFAVSASVDTIEHLSAQLRPKALAEMVRVSSKAVVVSFPRGDEAQQIDELYRDHLRRRGRSEPAWLSEHLAERYPTENVVIRSIREAAQKLNRRVEVTTTYSEWDWIASLIRAADTRSGRLGLIVDLALGIAGRMIPRPGESRSYRAIVTATFE